MRNALGGLITHLPAIALLGAPTVNSYKRHEPDAFAPISVSWSDDNRTVAIRSLLRTGATRIELRTPAADANPYWAVSSVLAAIVAGLEDDADPDARSVGYTFAGGPSLPRTLGDCDRDAPRRPAHRGAARASRRERRDRDRGGRMARLHDAGHRLGPRSVPGHRVTRGRPCSASGDLFGQGAGRLPALLVCDRAGSPEPAFAP